MHYQLTLNTVILHAHYRTSFERQITLQSCTIIRYYILILKAGSVHTLLRKLGLPNKALNLKNINRALGKASIK